MKEILFTIFTLKKSAFFKFSGTKKATFETSWSAQKSPSNFLGSFS
jgi:hypothetical protein